MEWISENGAALMHIAAMIIAVASAISALPPSGRDDALVGRLKKLIDMLALNFGHAKNRDA